jgi:exportin-1
MELFKSCLRTLQVYLSWIPLHFVFNEYLVETLISKFIQPAQTRVDAIKCITEISSIKLEEVVEDPNELRQSREKLCYYYCLLMQQIQTTVKDRSLLEEYNSACQSRQQAGFENFARQLALAISSVLKNNLDLIEETCNIMEPN